MRRTAAFMAAVLLVAGCGDGDGDQAGGDVDRYCRVTTELDAAGEKAFAAVERQKDATEEDFAAVERDFIAEHEDELGELAEAAPGEIRKDVETLVDAQRKYVAGDARARERAAVQAADKRVNAFEEQRCVEG